MLLFFFFLERVEDKWVSNILQWVARELSWQFPLF